MNILQERKWGLPIQDTDFLLSPDFSLSPFRGSNTGKEEREEDTDVLSGQQTQGIIRQETMRASIRTAPRAGVEGIRETDSCP